MERRPEPAAGNQGRRVPLAQHGNVQSPLERQQLLDADTPQEAEVGGAATQRDVLAVVELEPVPLEREGRTAEPRARLVERHRGSAVRAGDRRRETREPARRRPRPAAHRAAPARLRASTSPFSHGRSESRPAQDERRLGGDPLEQQPVLAGHREHAGGAPAVEQRHELEPAPEPLEPALGLERDHELDRARRRPPSRPPRSRSARALRPRQVDAPGRGVLADVAEDVSDLQARRRGRRRARSPRSRSEQSNTPSERRPIEPATQRQ